MNTRIVILPYKLGSESGKKLAEFLDAKRIKKDGEYEPRNGDLIVGWGCGYTPGWASLVKGKKVLMLNSWDKVCLSIDKVSTFELLRKGNVPTPEWSTAISKAIGWAKDGSWVCCRQSIDGKDGEGLVLAKEKEHLVSAPLYTKFISQANEYRAYVFGDQMVDIRHKRRDSEAQKAGKINEYVRTTSGNWVYCQYGFTAPKDAGPVAVAAVKALGLDFAGVDIVQSKADGKCYVLETNTAPYLGDHTAEKFATAINKRQKEWLAQL